MTRHAIYLRPSNPELDPSPDAERSLFLSNLPIDATQANLRALFKNLGEGRILQVDGLQYLHERPGTTLPGLPELGAPKGRKRKRGADGDTVKLQRMMQNVDMEQAKLPSLWERDVLPSGSSAVVVFVDRACRDKAIKLVRKTTKEKTDVQWPPEGVEEPPLGEKRYRAHHNLRYPSKAVLQTCTNAYLSLFTAAEQAHSRKLAAQRNEPDADGFVTVTRGGRTGPARQEEAERARVAMEEKKQKEANARDGFYRFQGRQKAKAREREMRKKFAEDVDRIKQRGKKLKPM